MRQEPSTSLEIMLGKRQTIRNEVRTTGIAKIVARVWLSEGSAALGAAGASVFCIGRR